MMRYFPHSDNRSWQWLATGSLLIVTVVLTLLGGILGVFFGGVLVVSWRQLPSEYTFVLGQFALVAAAPEVASPVGFSATVGLLALGEVGLIALLVTAQPDRELSALGLTASLIALGVILGWLSLHRNWVETTWAASAWLLGGGLILAYSLHRYERWQLGNPDEERVETYE